MWRGVSSADYPLHSSLYRLASAKRGALLREGTPRATQASLTRSESRVSPRGANWGLQRTATDRLSALELLAALQHQGIPTRLLHFSHNALVGLWFAVEERVDSQTREPHPDVDGRVFVVQSNGRQVLAVWPRLANLPWQARGRTIG